MVTAAGKWVVVELAGPEGLGPLIAGTNVTLEIGGDGSVSGFGGCNRLFGRVDEDGVIGPLGRTMMAGPPEVMAQEDAFLALLERAKSQVVVGDRLEVRDGDQVLLRLARVDEEIRGVTWVLRGIHDGGSGFTSVLGDVLVTLQFDDDGRLSGNSGCNRYTAAYDIGPDRLEIGVAGGTRMMCPEPVMEQEALYLGWLPRVASHRLSVGRSGRELDLEDSEGMRILQFVEEV